MALVSIPRMGNGRASMVAYITSIQNVSIPRMGNGSLRDKLPDEVPDEVKVSIPRMGNGSWHSKKTGSFVRYKYQSPVWGMVVDVQLDKGNLPLYQSPVWGMVGDPWLS